MTFFMVQGIIGRLRWMLALNGIEVGFINKKETNCLKKISKGTY